jgi:hypothetical protein
MPYFGKTPLTKNVSKFVQDFNTNLQYEMGLMYAPQNTQVNAVVTKMKEDAAYQQQKQQSIQTAMGSMIAADKGMNPADAAALAQMMAPKPTPQPTPQPPPSMMAPPTQMPTPMTGTGQTGGEVDPTTGLPFTFMPTPMGVEIDPSTGQPFMPPPPPPQMLPSTGPMGGELDPTTGLQFMPPIPPPPQRAGAFPAQRQFMGGQESIGASPPPQMLIQGDPTTFPVETMGPGGLGLPDITSWPGNIWGAAKDALSAYGEQALEGGGMKGFGTVPTESPFGSQVDPELGVTGDEGRPYQEDIDEFMEKFRDPALNNASKRTLLQTLLRRVYEKDGADGLNMLSSSLYTFLRDPALGTGRESQEDMQTWAKANVQPWLQDIKDYTAELLETGTEVPPAETGVIPSDDDELESVIAKDEAQQPAVDGQSYLDWLSAVDTGKNQIYEYFTDTDPQFRLMSPYAESVYGKAEKQMRHQYNLESLDSASQWFGRSAETPEAANRNYLDYLKAAFSPSNRTANLWSREQWSDKLNSIYQSAFTDKGQTIVGNAFLGGQPGYTTGALATGQLEPLTTAALSASAFREYARDPATVMEWIKAKSLKGANPIISFYGPAAVERSVNKWLIENTPSMDIGDPTDDPEGAALAAETAAMSLFDAWAKKDFQWFKTEGQSGKGYAAP